MAGLLLLGLLLFALSAVRKESASRDAKRDAIPGGPQHRAPANPQDLSLLFRTRARWLGPTQLGRDGDFDSLVRARRFAEASRLVPATDHRARAILAVARTEPVVDLVLAARMEPGRRDRKLRKVVKHARGMILQRYGGDPWGFKGKAKTPDAVVTAVNEAQVLVERGQLRRALGIYQRLERKFPNADDAMQWRLEMAFISSLLRKGAQARRLARAVAESDGTALARRQASRMTQVVAAPGSSQRPARSRRGRQAQKKMRKVLGDSGGYWPSTPHEIAASVGARHTVTDRDLDLAAMAQALRAGHVVWVGGIHVSGVATARAVLACAPLEGVVMLAPGHFFEWDELTSLTPWGQRMVVVHRKRATVPGEAPATNFDELSYPQQANGTARVDPEALAVLKAASQVHSRDSLASYIYAEGLLGALNAGTYGASFDALKRHLAVSAARFPTAQWPLAMLAFFAAPSSDGAVAHLSAMSVEAMGGRLPAAELARSAAMPGTRTFHLREANAIEINPRALIVGLEDAAARRDGDDVDAHLQLLQMVLPAGDEDLIRVQFMRELTWRGPGADVSIIADMFPPSRRQDTSVALACQSGRAAQVAAHIERYPSANTLEELFGRVCAAMHSGNLERIVDAAADQARVFGPTVPTVDALALAAPVLTPPGSDTAELFLTALSGRALTILGRSLIGERPETALSLLQAAGAAGADRMDAQLTRGVGLGRLANGTHGDERQDLASQAIAGLEGIRHLQSASDIWRFAYVNALRHLDPAKAMDEIRGWPQTDRPLVAFALAAAVADELDEPAVARAFRARVANAVLLNTSVGFATQFGLNAELSLAFAAVPRGIADRGAWQFYASGGDLDGLPEIPLRGETGLSTGALWRLADDGHAATLQLAVAHAFPPQTRMAVRDGAPVIAFEGLSVEGYGELPAMLSSSRHPAYLRAAQIARSHGRDFGIAEGVLEDAAPGLFSTEAAL